MLEPELGGMEEQARAVVGRDNRGTARTAVVYWFPTDRMAQFRQVNSYLVSSPSFQSAGQQGVARQVLDHIEMSDRLFAHAWEGSAATSSVASIAYQEGANGLTRDFPRHQRQVAANHRMRMKLPP